MPQGAQSVGFASILCFLDENLIYTAHCSSMVGDGFVDLVVVDIRTLDDHFDGFGIGVNFDNSDVDFFDSRNLADRS